MTNWEQSSKLILLTATQEVAEELSIDHSLVVQHLKQAGKVKKLIKWALCGLTTNQKKSSSWSVIFSYPTQQQRTISRLDCDVQRKVDFVQQLVMSSSVVGPRRSSKAFPEAKLVPKKGPGHCLVVCCQSDPLELSESQWNHYIWEVCSANCWNVPKTAAPAAGVGQEIGPILPHGSAQPAFQNLNELGTKFCLIHRIHLPSPIDYHVFKHLDHFLEAKCLHNQQEAEHGFQESVQFWSRVFLLGE